MRTSIVIDDQSMSRALESGDHKTKKSAIEAALKLLVQVNSQQKLRRLRGMIKWEGDLDQMRRD